MSLFIMEWTNDYEIAINDWKKITLLTVVAYELSNVIHECAHIIVFKNSGCHIMQIAVSVFLYDLEKREFHIENANIFRAFCKCKFTDNTNYRGCIIAFLAGGIGCLLVGFVLIAMWNINGNNENILLLQGVVLMLNFGINLINPKSTDRKMIAKIRREYL